MPEIYPFSEKGETYAEEDMERLGRRGRRAIELAEMKIPVVPGFVIDSRLTPELPSKDFSESLRRGLVGIEEGVGRKFGDAANPLLIKIVVSSNLSLPFYPTVFNVGLSPTTMPGFSTLIGEKAAWFEYCYLLRTIGTKIFDIAHERFDEIIARYSDDVEGMKKCAQEMVQLVGRDNVPDDPFQQFVVILKNLAKRYYNAEMDAEDPPALLVQGMVFGNLGEDSSVGMYYTRNIISGEDRLQGSFLLNSYTLDRQGQDILALDGEYLNRLQQIGRSIERKFRELREVKFIVEKKKLWIINQTEVDKKSTQAHIRTLLDLMKEGTVKDDWVVEQIPPGQLATLLHSVVDEESLAGIPAIRGGITGAPGAAVGRVFFNADRLMEAHRDAIQKGEDTRMVLVVTASYAEDVKAIEVGQGVISAEGGYSSHAPVVSRSLGKVSIVHPDIRIGDRFFEYNGVRVNEGDYVTMDAPVYRDPTIYTGKAKLISPDIHTNGLTDFIEVVRRFIKDDFVVRANADLGRDAKVARTMGAFGIGLCRTEHMFFAEDRIQRFREMILSSSYDERVRVLDDLRPLQRGDFYDLFKIMAPYPVTIRLLDAPLHEFLPRNDEALTEYLEYLQNKGIKPEKAEIQERIERLHEFNPMLGHRGCRVAITYPEIYEMQVRGIFEAATRLKKEGVDIVPEIMIPIVMNPSELRFLKNGKQIEGQYIKGIRDIAREIFHQEGVQLNYKVGTMVELPAAALASGDLAQHAEFFSYGTNDLTQTTFGLSRDDINSFFPAYTMYDLLPNNPFQVLGDSVKELIYISAERGRITRPDLKLGLCGEHGADPSNIEFCMEQSELDYVSTSPYNIPIALLAVAQLNLKKAKAQ
ncbi:putative PEP-binding protein [Leptonema illini]|jgi:pyruvate,orthophosphate dikinase|uniref:Pyruvate, phosphate dikinase n=1 Tax=Leptonema illini DSM 21528 TaxID=929563 RepID=H2CC32_9LEPT|nr:putative PEP-binding protein [Leptonema illini]EHQ05261.1 pyruvate phosphate dikinase [Leptonema illini DSM 21528]